MRISIRGWNEPLVDSEDTKEREQTRYVLRGGALPLIVAFFRLLLGHPIRTFRTLGLEFRMARYSERPLPVHLVYVAEACQIFLWLKQANITHLHAHFGTNSAEVAMLVRILGGPPWSFTVHGPEEFDRPYQIGLSEKILRATFVVAISSFGRSQLFRFAAHSEWNKIFVVRCGLDPEYFVEDFQFDEMRTFVCVGRLCEQKGQLLLVDAARRLVDRGVSFRICLAGDGELRPAIEKLLRQYKLTETIRITGWISSDDVRRELLNATAFVLPSFAEGLPVAIMEAMALGRPVISTYVAGIPELVISGQNGWLIQAGDVDALAGAMADCLMRDKEDLRKLGCAARDRTQMFHNADREAEKLKRLFQGNR
jgi:colanic acid/amylovoran biosynthesis glycosyltransferase